MSEGRLTKQDLSASLAQQIDDTAAQAQNLETTTEELATKLTQSAKGIYIIDNKKWGISDNGTNPVETLTGIKNAIADAKAKGYNHIKLSAGMYLVRVDSNGNNRIKLPSNTRFTLDDNAIVKAEATTMNVYMIFEFQFVENVILEGGTVEGDRETHVPKQADYQALIHVWDSKNITIRDMKIINSPSLGIRVRENIVNSVVNTCENVRIYNNEIAYIHQCGIANEAVEGVWIYNNHIHHVAGRIPEAGIDIEGKIVSNAHVYQNRFNNNGQVDILVYSPSANGVKAENIFISGNYCTKKMWIESDYGNVNIWNNVINNPNSTGSVLDDYSLYIKGKYIHMNNNTVKGYTYLYRITESFIDGLDIVGNAFKIQECTSDFKDISFKSTVNSYGNFRVYNCPNTKFINLKLENCNGVIENNVNGLQFENLEFFNFVDSAIEIYGLSGNRITFKNPFFHDRISSSSNSKALMLINSPVKVLINNITVENVLTTSTQEFFVADNAELNIIGGYLKTLGRLVRTASTAFNIKVKLSQLLVDKTGIETDTIVDVGGDTELIATGCTFISQSVGRVAVKTDLATKNAIIAQNVFSRCVNTTKTGDTVSNNTLIA